MRRLSGNIKRRSWAVPRPRAETEGLARDWVDSGESGDEPVTPPVSELCLGGHESERPEKIAAKITFSVIVPCLNEEAVIAGCLDSLVKQDVPHEAFEVLVIDNGSTDGTLQIVSSFDTKLHLTVLQRPNAHISALRNLGAERSRGQILAFLDADCLAPPDWLRQAGAFLERDPGCVIGAPYRVPDGSSWVAQTWYGDRKRYHAGSVEYVPSGDLVVSRSDFLRIGGFDERLETNEDCEFCYRARAAGVPVVGVLEIAVVHLGTPQTLGGFFHKQRWHGKHAFKVFLRDPRKLHNARAVLFALYNVVCLFGISGGLIVLVASRDASLLYASVLAILTVPFALSLRAAALQRVWPQVLALTAMNLAYGLARAMCVLDVRTWLDFGEPT